jgi:hypothetical protein
LRLPLIDQLVAVSQRQHQPVPAEEWIIGVLLDHWPLWGGERPPGQAAFQAAPAHAASRLRSLYVKAHSDLSLIQEAAKRLK